MRRLISAATLALTLLLTSGCQSTPDSGSSSGASSSGGSSSGGTTGAAVASAAQGGDTHDGTYTSTFDGCTVFFGIRPASSNTYFVSASREGIGGQAGWTCAPVSGVSRLQLTAVLEYGLTLAGPWTPDPEHSATASFDGDKRTGTLFPINSTCTTDWWRVRVTIGWDEAGGGHLTRPDITSQPRKVTDEDCHRA